MENEKYIYLISDDRHKNSIDLENYFETDEELIDFVKKDFPECNYGSTINSIDCFIDLDGDKNTVVYYYESNDKTNIWTKFYYTFKLRKYDKE